MDYAALPPSPGQHVVAFLSTLPPEWRDQYLYFMVNLVADLAGYGEVWMTIRRTNARFLDLLEETRSEPPC